MRRAVFILLLSFSLISRGQTFWTETFGAGACSGGALASAYVGPNGAWSVTNTGTNNSSANTWFVSAKERGMGVGICGAGCGGTNSKTLHLGSAGGFFNDPGAAYNETGTANTTDKRAESPAINCTGKTTITLSFSYMENGQGLLDNATLWYFNGVSWALLIDIPKTLCCSNAACTGFNQGLWVNYSIVLPVSANNNAGVKIGFRWVNNGNGVGTDPSVAIDDITLSTPVVLPIELAGFTATPTSEVVELEWFTMMEKDFKGFVIERSENGIGFAEIGFIESSGNSSGKKNYFFTDDNVKNNTYYYRLKAIDNDQSYKYSEIKAVRFTAGSRQTVFYNSISSEIIIPVKIINLNESFNCSLISPEGKTLKTYPLQVSEAVNNEFHIPAGDLSAGVYFIRLYDGNNSQSFKLLIAE